MGKRSGGLAEILGLLFPELRPFDSSKFAHHEAPRSAPSSANRDRSITTARAAEAVGRASGRGDNTASSSGSIAVSADGRAQKAQPHRHPRRHQHQHRLRHRQALEEYAHRMGFDPLVAANWLSLLPSHLYSTRVRHFPSSLPLSLSSPVL